MLTGFLVTSTSDSTDVGTLRWAIEQANESVGADTITFDASFNAVNVITLDGTQLPTLNDTTGPTIISGPGAGLLTINGDDLSRIFEIAAGTFVSIDALTITHGNALLEDGEPSFDGGGAIANFGQLTLTHVTLTGNNALHLGGAIANSGFLNISDSSITHNSGGNGGGIFNTGTLIADHVELVENSTVNGGGAIFTEGLASLSYCLIDGNTVSYDLGYGGGIYQATNERAVLSIIYSTISNNSAGGGGGIFNSAQLTVASSTITGNTATDGGGISNHDRLRVVTSTLTGNTAETGGAIENLASMDLAGVTITGNTATTRGAGINQHNYYAQAALINAIVAGNLTNGTADNIAGSVDSLHSHHNLFGPGSNGFYFSESTDSIFLEADAYLGLGPLADNGGPTQTMALLEGSPAIDMGILYFPSGASTSYDQRGTDFSRIHGIYIDIGAFESEYSNGYSSVYENDSDVTYVFTFDAYFLPVTYTITGGADQSQFTLNPTTGKLEFVAPPDFEHPTDADADSIYHFDVTITGFDGSTGVVPWTVRVKNLLEAPVLTLASEPATYHIGDGPLTDATAHFETELDERNYVQFNGSKLVVSISANRDAKDVLKIESQGRGAGKISLKKKNVLFGGVVIGTVAGGTKASPNLVITFNSQATEAAVDALVNQVSFSTKNRQLPQPSRTLQMQLVNLSGWESNTATRQIHVVGRS